jgi:uncharacterized protein
MNFDTLAARDTATGTRIDLRVTPRAARTAVDGVRDGRLVLKVTAPPVDDAANQAVVLTLARALDVPKGSVRITAGATGRNKSVEIDGLRGSEVRRRLTTGAATLG